MLQLQNNTPFATSMALFPNEEAVDTLYLMVRATFTIGEQWTLADVQLPPTEADVYWGEPGESSIQTPSDYHTGKLNTDIIMLGHASAPNDQTVNQLDVSLAVGPHKKTIRVFGDRQWQHGRITAPQPFNTMAMVYERAYGGAHRVDGEVAAIDARNPVGRGFAGSRNADEMNGVPLPNLEDPASLINSIYHQPAPACFAVSAPHWLPRSGFVGTYDEPWRAQRAPYLPTDFDKQFYNMAHPDLVCSGFLTGGEPVEITHMHPRGKLKFDVPHVMLSADVTMAGDRLKPTFNLETLLIEPNQLQLSMLWRAAVPCDKKALTISDVTISLAR
jgi:hypothetical protein